MTFIFDQKERIIKTALITGPSHNFLGLRFNVKSPSLSFINLDEDAEEKLDLNKIRMAVLDGFKEAHHHFNFPYLIESIFYLESDTPRYITYKVMTYRMIEWVIQQKIESHRLISSCID